MEVGVREQIVALLKLQEVDAKLADATRAFQEIPAALRDIENEIARFQSMLEEERSHLEEAVRYLREQEELLKEDEQRIQKTKQQLQQIRNAREYAATHRQLETFKKVKLDREEEILRLMEAVEGSRKRLEQHEKEFEELRAHLEAKKQDLERELEGARQKQEAMEAERQAAASAIRPEVLARYEAVAQKVQPAVVPARHSVCTGCNMNIPPQLYNVLFRVNSIETCPFCLRILYLEAAVFGEGEPGASGASV